MQLSSQTIRGLCEGDQPLIAPFSESYQDVDSGLSGGLSCAGYDVHIRSLADVTSGDDPLFKARAHYQYSNDQYPVVTGWWIPQGVGVLAVTQERFIIPDDLCMMYFNKSSNARIFLNSAATLAEPGWEGHLTLEIINDTDFTKFIHRGQPIGQVIFNQLDHPTDSPYRGKYQDQGDKPVQAILETE